MKGARYLVRFDDICPTMNWAKWENVEALLLELDIKPLVAVVPANRDSKLTHGAPREDFWSRIRSWQAAGWTIGLHGFEHLYETGSRGLIGINAYSEFAGLPATTQKRKLEAGLGIFAANGVRADAWIAPAHSFDRTTVEVLRELGIRVISDGFYWRPVARLGAVWVPQQVWRFRYMPAGVWTVCYHTNELSAAALDQLACDLRHFRDRITTLPEVLSNNHISSENMLDRMFSWCWMNAVNFKRQQTQQ